MWALHPTTSQTHTTFTSSNLLNNTDGCFLTYVLTGWSKAIVSEALLSCEVAHNKLRVSSEPSQNVFLLSSSCLHLNHLQLLNGLLALDGMRFADAR